MLSETHSSRSPSSASSSEKLCAGAGVRDQGAETHMKRNASVTWSGSARDGEGTFRVGSGALTAPFTYNSRFRGDSQTNPEELLLSALAGCLTMAMAAALREGKGGGGKIETSAELDLVAHESGGYRIPKMALELVVAGEGSQEELDSAL